MHFRRLAVFLAFTLLQPVVWAETCKYLDSEGHVIYSNTPNNPPKGATKVKCFEGPSPKPAPDTAKNPDTKAKLPQVSEDTQKTRDAERRRILEQEIADETRQLAQTKEQLAAQEAVRDGNERNIEAIRREIANLK